MIKRPCLNVDIDTQMKVYSLHSSGLLFPKDSAKKCRFLPGTSVYIPRLYTNVGVLLFSTECVTRGKKTAVEKVVHTFEVTILMLIIFILVMVLTGIYFEYICLY